MGPLIQYNCVPPNFQAETKVKCVTEFQEDGLYTKPPIPQLNQLTEVAREEVFGSAVHPPGGWDLSSLD